MARRQLPPHTKPAKGNGNYLSISVKRELASDKQPRRITLLERRSTLNQTTESQTAGQKKPEIGRLKSDAMSRAIAPTENHLKVRILNELRRTKRIRPTTIVANELPLGGTGLRADLALHSRYFIGIEVKSNRDSLKRLPRQLPIYRDYFDRTILVIGSKHWEEASKLDLSGVELWVASGMSLRRTQHGSLNEQTINHNRLISPTLQKKYRSLSDDARTLFLTAFRERFGVTSKQFWDAIENRQIAEQDLALLSRYSDKREQSAALLRQSRRSHEEWLNELVQSVQASSVSKNDASSS